MKHTKSYETKENVTNHIVQKLQMLSIKVTKHMKILRIIFEKSYNFLSQSYETHKKLRNTRKVMK